MKVRELIDILNHLPTEAEVLIPDPPIQNGMAPITDIVSLYGFAWLVPGWTVELTEAEVMATALHFTIG